MSMLNEVRVRKPASNDVKLVRFVERDRPFSRTNALKQIGILAGAIYGGLMAWTLTVALMAYLLMGYVQWKVERQMKEVEKQFQTQPIDLQKMMKQP